MLIQAFCINLWIWDNPFFELGVKRSKDRIHKTQKTVILLVQNLSPDYKLLTNFSGGKTRAGLKAG